VTRPDPPEAASSVPALLDAGRRALVLPRRLVPVAMLLHTAAAPDATGQPLARCELERAGITAGGRLHPLAASILGVVTEPRVVVSVEVTETGPPSIATIWAEPRRAVLGRPVAGDGFELHEIAPALIPFHLAQLVELSGSTTSATGRIVVPTALLHDVGDQLVLDPEAARERLRLAGVGPDVTERLVELHTRRAQTWRVASLWAGPDGSAHDDELVVMDAGEAGYWQVSTGDEETAFVPRELDDLLLRLRDLLP
jgi:hypothetical protein